ncbi:hypothetical protein MRX96_037625 [Rhipicephalus microplus]
MQSAIKAAQAEATGRPRQRSPRREISSLHGAGVLSSQRCQQATAAPTEVRRESYIASKGLPSVRILGWHTLKSSSPRSV